MPILAKGSSGAHQRQQQEKQSRYFKPENVGYAANIAGGHLAGIIKSPHPAILAGPVARYSQECAALPAESARGQATSFL